MDIQKEGGTREYRGDVEAPLKGFMKPEYLACDGKYTIASGRGIKYNLYNIVFPTCHLEENPIVKLTDARPLQAAASSPAAFFKEHGFVLMKCPTKVKGWNEEYQDRDNDIVNIYQKEVE